MTPETWSLTFPGGLVGLPELRRFELTLPTAGRPLGWLQSAEEPALGFAVADPFRFVAGYELEIPAGQAAGLGAEPPLVLTIVRIPEDPAGMTANLAGPLLIDLAAGSGRQVVLNDGRYGLREPLLARRPEVARC